MRKPLLRLLCLLLAICAVLPLSTVSDGYQRKDAVQLDLSAWIEDDEYREYVQMMVDYYVRTDTMIQSALEGGFSAVFLFDGCSDNMHDTALNDLSYYRVSGVCLVVRLDDQGNPKLAYFCDNCSTIPDRPLEYGAWSLPDVGSVGPATVYDGTYQLYSVMHKGRYEALNVRTEYWDSLLDAVYMTPDGYVTSRASEINIHTRTSNHTSGVGMWSAGCPLVGGGSAWEFWKLIRVVYYSCFDTFEVGNFVGTVTIDRQKLRHALYTLYEDPDAVDAFLVNSWNARPAAYLSECTEEESYEKSKTYRTLGETKVMSLPCGNGTDARSLERAVIAQGEAVEVTGSILNTKGEKWYTLSWEGETCYVSAAMLEKVGWFEKLFGKI